MNAPRDESDPPRQVTPWPAWVRYPLVAGFALVVLFGLVSALTSGVDAAAWRVVVVAVLVPALLTPLVVWGRVRRERRTPSARGPAGFAEPTPVDLAPVLRAAGQARCADRLEHAHTASGTPTEFLAEALHILDELLREHPALPPDLDDRVRTTVRALSALLR